MRVPLHTIQIASHFEQNLGDLIRNGFIDIPTEIRQQIDERDLFAFRFFVEDFVLELLPEVRMDQLTQRSLSPRYQIKVELGNNFFSVNFNGHKKLITDK